MIEGVTDLSLKLIEGARDTLCKRKCSLSRVGATI
jgi:hypothetical protein